MKFNGSARPKNRNYCPGSRTDYILAMRQLSLTWFQWAWPAACLLAATAGAQDERWVIGITEPINDVTMSSAVVGIVGSRPVVEGADVKKGDMLIALDRKMEELEVARRKLVRDLAKADIDRLQALSERSAISVSREQIEKKQAEYNVASVEFELAGEQLHRKMLFAPFDGQVTEIFRQVGEGCEAQQPLVRLVDTRRCYFICNIEAQAGYALRTGQIVKLEIAAGEKPAAMVGTISFVSPVVDPASGLLKVKVVFENPDGKIRPGVSGRMSLKEIPNA